MPAGLFTCWRFSLSTHAPVHLIGQRISLHQHFSNFLLSVPFTLLKIIENLMSVYFVPHIYQFCHIKYLNREIKKYIWIHLKITIIHPLHVNVNIFIKKCMVFKTKQKIWWASVIVLYLSLQSGLTEDTWILQSVSASNLLW